MISVDKQLAALEAMTDKNTNHESNSQAIASLSERVKGFKGKTSVPLSDLRGTHRALLRVKRRPNLDTAQKKDITAAQRGFRAAAKKLLTRVNAELEETLAEATHEFSVVAARITDDMRAKAHKQLGTRAELLQMVYGADVADWPDVEHQRTAAVRNHYGIHDRVYGGIHGGTGVLAAKPC